MLKKFGTDVITFHGTHGVSYDLQLYTIMVLDEVRQDFLCCFIISNRRDEEIVSFAFVNVKKIVGAIHSQVFMSNMATHFYNAWEIFMVHQHIVYTVSGVY